MNPDEPQDRYVKSMYEAMQDLARARQTWQGENMAEVLPYLTVDQTRTLAASVALPRRCNYYNPNPDVPDCKEAATHICAMDDGEPGATGVMSCFRCKEHSEGFDIVSSMLYESWYAKNILKVEDTLGEWDL